MMTHTQRQELGLTEGSSRRISTLAAMAMATKTAGDGTEIKARLTTSDINKDASSILAKMFSSRQSSQRSLSSISSKLLRGNTRSSLADVAEK